MRGGGNTFPRTKTSSLYTRLLCYNESMQLELWKQISGFGSKYYVSNLGNVKNTDKNLTPYRNKLRGNYLYINLQYKKERKNALLHRLVAQYFIPNPLELPEINHKDFNRSNNTVENLEWVTRTQNYEHSKKSGRYGITVGEDCWNSILTTKDVKNIIHERMKTKTTYKVLAKKYGVKYSTIAHIMRRSRWGHVWKELGL